MKSLAPLDTEPFRPRATRPAGVVQRSGWTIKITTITASDDPLDEAVTRAALDYATTRLPEPGVATGSVAVLIVHRGAAALWVIVAWWSLDIMYHTVFRSDLEKVAFSRVPDGGPSACVWELAVIDHERRAWIEHVLSRPEAPDFPGYLDNGITGG